MVKKPSYEELEEKVLQLQQAEAKFRLLAESMSDIVWTVDLDLKTTYVSPSIHEILGYTPEERMKQTVEEMVTPGSLKTIRKLLKREFLREKMTPWSTKKSLTVMTEYYVKGGGTRWLENHVRWIRDENGKISGIHGISRDITRRRREEILFKRAAEASSDLIFEWEMDTDRLIWHGDINSELGYGPDKSFKTLQDWLEIIHPDDRERLRRDFDLHRTSAEKMEIVYRIKHRDGSWRFWSDKGLPVLSEEGKPCRWVSVCQDITRRKLAQDELVKSRQKYLNLIENQGEGIAVVNTDEDFTFANPASERIFGVSSGGLVGRNLYEFLDEANSTAISLQTQNRRDGRTGSYEVAIIRPDGRKRELQVTANPQYENGEYAGAFGIFRDITHQRRMEAEKEQLQKQLQQAQKMESVGRLAGGVAHDFNNMLSVISGHAEMIEDQLQEDSEILGGIREIRKAAAHSTSIVSQLLAFARKQTVSPRVLDLNRIVEKILKMLKRLIGEDVHLNWKPHQQLWPVRVDPSQIDQVLANLSINARDAIDGVGNIYIETDNVSMSAEDCRGRSEFEPGDYVTLSVCDDGRGMDEKTRKNVFEPFFTTKDVGQGTGLGLATVYGIVKQNNGFIYVYSEPGQGSCFRIYLPRHSSEPADTTDTVEETSFTGGSETVLLVEDEPAILNMTTSMLELMGYTVLAAQSPEVALKQAEKYPEEIHLLITDVVMPQMNGLDLAEKLRREHSELKCLFMSGYTSDIIASQGVIDEKVNFIQKPFTSKALSIKVREALDSSG
ncbi:MAG: PAS domain S-box protein [Candidatus Aegiribacteria sp.]|nr:PAS domain S-box protein [Candidatus Aegiribacteria sp.]MBD3295106.1 PAS domain S-box protein [Candidatus Fermentibacteria bacterium]